MGKVLELQDLMDRQSKEVLQMKERVVALSHRVTELEEDLDTARKDLIKSEDVNTRLQRDIREVRHAHTPVCSSVLPQSKNMQARQIQDTKLFITAFDVTCNE